MSAKKAKKKQQEPQVGSPVGAALVVGGGVGGVAKTDSQRGLIGKSPG